MKIFFEVLSIIASVAILFYLIFYFAHISLAPATQQSLSNSVCMNEKCFQVELAKTEAERDKGLMNVAQLDKNKGMLFIFDKEGIHTFWMKNTLIPLDMIWINSNSKVVFISQKNQPCKSLVCRSVIPTAKAKYVLEVNEGIIEEINLKLGDEVKMNVNFLK